MEKVLKLSDQNDFKVFIGLPTLMVDWMLAEEEELAEVTSKSAHIAEEIYDRYKKYNSFHGWYIPYELCNVFIRNKPEEKMLPAWIGSLAAECKKVVPEKPVLIAPYFTTTLELDEFENLWSMVLEETGVDILAMQDSVGVHGDDRLKELGAYFAVLKKVCTRYGVSLWADSEVFHQVAGIPKDNNSWQATPTSVNMLLEQISVLSKYVERIIIFCFSHYMSPQFSKKADKLYIDYKKFRESKL